MAFENAGCQCVFSSEWDPACQLMYEANFGVPQKRERIILVGFNYSCIGQSS